MACPGWPHPGYPFRRRPPVPAGPRWRSDHPAAAERPAGPSRAVGRPAAGAPAAEPGGRAPGVEPRRVRDGRSASRCRGSTGLRRAGAALRARGRAARRPHPAHVGAASTLGRGELPGRSPGRRRGPLEDCPARGSRGDRPRRRASSRWASSTTCPPSPAARSSCRSWRPCRGARTVANPTEVSDVLHVPIAELLDPAIFREERWTFPWAEDRPIFFFELVGDTVWGATRDAPPAPRPRHRHRHPWPARSHLRRTDGCCWHPHQQMPGGTTDPEHDDAYRRGRAVDAATTDDERATTR